MIWRESTLILDSGPSALLGESLRDLGAIVIDGDIVRGELAGFASKIHCR